MIEKVTIRNNVPRTNVKENSTEAECRKMHKRMIEKYVFRYSLPYNAMANKPLDNIISDNTIRITERYNTPGVTIKTLIVIKRQGSECGL